MRTVAWKAAAYLALWATLYSEARAHELASMGAGALVSTTQASTPRAPTTPTPCSAETLKIASDAAKAISAAAFGKVDKAAEPLWKIGRCAYPALPALFLATRREQALEDVWTMREGRGIDAGGATLGVLRQSGELGLPAMRVALSRGGALEQLIVLEFISDGRQDLAASLLPELTSVATTTIVASAEGRDDLNQRGLAAELLGAAGARGIPFLIQVLKVRTSADGRESAMVALAGLGPLAAEAVPALIEELDYEVHRVDPRAEPIAVQTYAWALGAIGPSARAALPALYDALKLSDESLFQQGVKDAISKIEGRTAPFPSPKPIEAGGAAIRNRWS
ncbi:MAG: hypothetical protein K1Y01_05920 [Vicinamibacteria bacterium]|nr:hypothetical protein [Vicinamibacteria bacterium]